MDDPLADEEQILGVLPDLKNKDVLELGGGIGRFTGYLAERSGSVATSDFIESFIEKNKELHGHLSNISFSVGDATSLSHEDESFDFVFTNWLLMYLTDEEVVNTVKNILNWLKPWGKFHLRESCTESSNKKRTRNVAENPTYYRHVSQYLSLLENIRVEHDGKTWKFQVTWANSVEVYVTYYQNWRQVHMIIEKVPSSKASVGTSEDQWLMQKLGKDTLSKQITCAQRHEACKKLLGCISPIEKYFIGIVKSAHHLEIDTYQYSVLLDEANHIQDPRVRILWSPKPDFADGFPAVLRYRFNLIVGCGVFSQSDVRKTLCNVKSCLSEVGTVMFLEGSANSEDGLMLPAHTLKSAGFSKIEICVVTQQINHEVQAALENVKHKQILSSVESELVRDWLDWFGAYSKWFLICASL